MINVFNFSAGPAMLPHEVMTQAQAEFLDWHGTGVSIAEVSHRGKLFQEIVAQSRQDLRDLLNIPSNYHILFLSGGARTQFSAIPMNLLGEHKSAGYIQTGYWGMSAAKEAARYCDVKIVANNAPDCITIPIQDTWQNFSDCAYLHYVDNETVEGIEFDFIPETKNVPLICDMSSNILSRPFDVSKFGLIYASAQKNISIAGITVVIIRDDLLSRQKIKTIPTILDYVAQVKANSCYNTVPTYPWYLAGLVLQWIKKIGGLEAIAQKNAEKAALLYDYLDGQTFYKNHIEKRYRSKMNVVFRCPTPELDVLFYQSAEKAGLLYLKGHPVFGGLRASIYNAMPIEGVKKLIVFMQEFSIAHGLE